MARCIGCGLPLQTTDPGKPGYVSESTLATHGEQSYCYRCYQIRNYGKISHYEFNLDKYRSQLAQIRKDQGLVVLIIDVLDPYGSFHDVIIEAVKDSDVIILINKVDLLPKDMKLTGIEEHVKEIGEKKGLKVRKVIAISALKDYRLDVVMNAILKFRHNASVYLVGLANTGKSSFLNAIIRKYTDEKSDLVTTSYVQGTTADLIKIPLDKETYLIDTPGFISDTRYATYLSDASMKLLTPKKYLKPTVFQLDSLQTIFVGGLFRLDLTEGENMSVTTFFANDVYIHRTKSSNADALYEKQLGQTLVPPLPEETGQLGKLVLKDTLKLEAERYDILVGGVGIIHLTGKGMTIKVHAPAKIGITVVPSFL